MDLIQRNLTDQITEALSDRPVVLINGARQTGKSTLVQMICKQRGYQYFTLDDFSVLSAAKSDPAGFISGIESPVAIDEVQRVPELFLAIKAAVDRDRKPGQFLLTGSANVMFLPRIADTLTGRMEIFPLRPFSKGEIIIHKESFIDLAFSNRIPSFKEETIDRKKLFDEILIGGYPEVLRLRSKSRRIGWFQSYLTTLLQREVNALSRIEGLSEMPRLLSLVASQVCSLLNMSDLARNLGISHMTFKRYITLLEAIFVIEMLPAWFGNVGKRLIKAPKVFLNDTGLLGYLLGLDTRHLIADPNKAGPLVENFVMQELNKQRGWSQTPVNLFYYRTAGGKEVDFVLETRDGRIVGLEVKSSASVQSSDFKGLHDMAETTANRFHRGILLYVGNQVVPFAKNLHAVPIGALWE
jgi:predicted AAA+ superfamily ATPase